MSVDYRAAWVPFDQDNGQTPAMLGLAVTWVEQECVEQGRAGLLITPGEPISRYAEPIQEFAARHERITRRGRMRRPVTGGGGPVLVHWPTFDDLYYAAGLARGSSLCAIELPDVPLIGWASAVGALNLVTGETRLRPADEVVRLLDQLHFAGNNGWFDGPGERDALRLLSELRTAAPHLDERFIASYMLGMGKVFPEAAKHLLELAGRSTAR